ncbi:J domain-containing protein [Winogradskyella eckloniae]|uniref:J domain-containing protein n=1 Tax=Winogradskyella eckloniae TaxID=1089306 RepID=UPI00156708F2|nr:J domain-containing protein [Winogradskyella eckloniae]NRD19687.1 J domain-containing protein [Winogradskyella eckloniae]
MNNHYELLKIETTANLETIKKAFRREIAIYHPDNNKTPEAAEKFEALVEAFDILSTIEKRKIYDELLQAKQNNVPIVIEHKAQYTEWQKEAKSKSKTYSELSFPDLFLLDIFIEAGVEGAILGAETLDGIGDSAEGIGEILGDIVGGILDGI